MPSDLSWLVTPPSRVTLGMGDRQNSKLENSGSRTPSSWTLCSSEKVTLALGVLELDIAPSSTGGVVLGEGCRCSELESAVLAPSGEAEVLSIKELSRRRESLSNSRELSSHM